MMPINRICEQCEGEEKGGAQHQHPHDEEGRGKLLEVPVSGFSRDNANKAHWGVANYDYDRETSEDEPERSIKLKMHAALEMGLDEHADIVDKKHYTIAAHILYVFSNSGIFSIFAFIILATFILFDLYLVYYVVSFPPGTTLPISSATNYSNTCVSSALCIVNVKSLFMDPPNFYAHHPFAGVLVRALDMGNRYLFLTPNMISVSHVMVSLFSGRLIANDSLSTRRIGVLLYQLRNMLDAVDGWVAKERKRVSGEDLDGYNNMKVGYWVDGVTDGIGLLFLYLGCCFYLRKHPVRKQQRSLFSYSALPTVSTTKERKKSNREHGDITLRQVFQCVNRSRYNTALFGFQALFSSIAWNACIARYMKMLEHNSTDQTQTKWVKANLLRSPLTWIIIFIWRYINPHSVEEIVLVAIFLNKMGELLQIFKLWGYFIIAVAAGLTELHLSYIYSLFL